nr:Leucine-rich repeat-containing protein [Ipomoea batatas]
MKSRTNGISRAQKSKALQGEGPNWVLIAGGALLSTLSVRLGYKLKQVLDAKQQNTTGNTSKENNKPAERKKARNCHLQSSSYCFNQDDENCYNCLSGTRDVMDMKQQCNGQVLTESETELPLVTVPSLEFSRENGGVCSSSVDRLELPQKPLHLSNGSESPCVSESGSDIFSKREVIQKLRQQVKRRDEMILEMQEQIVELQSSLNAQLSHSSHLQSLLDVANRDLFDSEREIQRLRKVIADHCVGQADSCEKLPTVPSLWGSEGRNGYANGHFEAERHLKSSEKGRGDGERIEMLRREVAELKEVIDGKEYLLQSYKDQKAELSTQVKELQQRLDSQLPNIL